MSDPIIMEEPTGLFEGTVQENMIDTVKRVKKPFIDVLVTDYFSEGTEYPLTYVPMHFMVSDLAAGDKVKVRFNQENMRYPVLYKVDSEILPAMYEKFILPTSGAHVDFPESQETVSVIKLAEDSYWLDTGSYSVLRKGDTTYLMDTSGFVFGGSSFEANGGDTQIKLDGSKIMIQNASLNMGQLMDDLCSALLGLTTFGSPSQHSPKPSFLTSINTLKGSFAALLDK